MTAADGFVEVCGERLTLLAERALFWARESTLLVADPHFGKAAAFRAAGVPVPRGTTSGTLARLDAAIARTAARRVVFLGDFLHARAGRAADTLAVIEAWREARSEIDVVLVRGNHDVRAGDPPESMRIRCVESPLAAAPFVFAHHPRPSTEGYVVCGHVHPGVRLAGAARERSRMPCFWFGREVGVLPAFGEFTGLADVEPAPGDGVWVVADDAVIQILPRKEH